MIKPVYTEKSLKDAKQGKYTFWVGAAENKLTIKALLASIFGVHVTSIKTLRKGSEKGRNARGRKFSNLSAKKAIITIKDGEKIDVFEESKK